MSEASLDPLVLLARQGWVEGLARGLVKDSSLAQDLAQEAWLVAARTAPEDPGALRGFLAGIVRNLRSGVRRSDARRERRERAAARPEALPSPAELVERAELQRLLVESVLALDEHERTAILLRYFEGLTAEEIARRSLVPAGTVRARLSRGLEKLRVRLEARVDRRDLFAGLCALARTGPTGAPLAEATTEGSTLPWIGGLLAMKTWTMLAAGAAVLLSLSAGLYLLGREPARRGASEAGEAELVRVASVEPAPAVADLAPASVPQRDALPDPTPAAAEPEPPPAAAPAHARVLARLVDEEGQGLPNVEVRYLDEPAGSSGAGGRLEVELATESRGHLAMLEFRLAGYALARRRARIEAGAEVHLGDVALARGIDVHGRVEDERGRPLAGADVLSVGLENPRTDPEELRRLGPLQEEATVLGDSGADGRFVLDAVPQGRWRVWAGADGYAWSSTVVEVGRDGAEDVALVLQPLRDADRITARVLAPDGTPVSRALAYTWYTAANIGSGGMAYTDEQGRLELLLEQRVAHDLTVQDPDNRWSEIYAFGVEPGTHDLELRFREARWIDVSASDPGGEPLDAFELELESATEGNWLRMTAGRAEPLEGAAAGRTRLRVPNARFRVVAEAVGREQIVEGPFDPEAPPATLAFRLAALPGVRGIVRSPDGAPVADAAVGLHRVIDARQLLERDGFRLTTEQWTETKTKTDADGRFLLHPPPPRRGSLDSGDFVLRADATGYARTELPPRAFDRKEGAEVELVLTRGGAIEGRARTAATVDPTGLLVAFHRGDGDVRTQRLDPDGRYRVEGLTPGGWMVQALDDELFGSRSSSSATYYEDGAPPFDEWTCVVVEGETTRHDLDLTDHAPATLHGVFALESRSLAGWTAALELPEGGDESVIAAEPVDAQGQFTLTTERGGRFRLVLRGPEEAHGRLTLREDLDLTPGETRWSLALRPGRLEGSGALGRGTRERFYRYDWRGDLTNHDLVVSVRIVPDSDGRFVLPTVPEGPGSISRNDPPASGQDFAPWEVVSEFDLPAAGARSVVVP